MPNPLRDLTHLTDPTRRRDRGGRFLDGPRFKPSSTRQMSEPERAYVGAMIDGEGTVVVVDRNTRRGQNLRLQVINTDLEIISALLRATGVGRVHVHYGGPDKKLCWAWDVSTANDIRDIAEQVQPYSFKAQRIIPDAG